MISFREGLQLDLRNIKVESTFIGYFIKHNSNNIYNYSTNNTTFNDAAENKSNPFVGCFKPSPYSSSRNFLLLSRIGLKALILGDDYNTYKPFISQGSLLQEKRYAESRVLQDALELVPQSSIYSISSNDHHHSCAICSDIFKDGDVFRTLKCSHLFHKDCIDTLLVGLDTNQIILTNICPCCKLESESDSSKISSQSFIRLGLNLLAANQEYDSSIDENIDRLITDEKLFCLSQDSEEKSDDNRSWIVID